MNRGDARGVLAISHRMRLFGLVGVQAGLIAGLHILGRVDGFQIEWSNLSMWLTETPFEDAAGAVLLLAALVLSYWLLLSTVSYMFAAASSSPGAIRAVGWVTLPPIRRLVSRALALSIAASSVAGPLAPAIAKYAGSGEASRVIVAVDSQGRLYPPGAASETETEADTNTMLPPHLTVPTEPPAPAPVPEPAEVLDGSRTHEVVVKRGEHLWSISERHLEEVLGRQDLSEHEIARYWVGVIDANRSSIRSGDPDLIYPGERILLPPVG